MMPKLTENLLVVRLLRKLAVSRPKKSQPDQPGQLLHIISLPPELVLQVFRYFDDDRVQLKSLRFVCKVWSYLAPVVLFDKVVVSPHLANIQALKSIVEHPTYSAYVKELVYDASSFTQISTPEDYEQELRITHKLEQLFGCLPPGSTTGATDIRLVNHHAGLPFYQAYYREQQQLLPRIPVLLATTLKKLTTIQKITIQSSWTLGFEKKRFSRFLGPGVVARNWPIFVSGPRPCAPSSVDNVAVMWPLIRVACALRETDRSIKHLCYDEFLSRTNMLNWVTSSHLEGVLGIAFESVLAIIGGLRKLEIRLPSHKFAFAQHSPHSIAPLTRVLDTASTLTELSLGAWSFRPGRACLRKLKFVKLQVFRLEEGIFSQDELSVFLQRHDETIHTLSLDRIQVCGSWADLLDIMHNQMRTLKRVEFSQCPHEWHRNGSTHVKMEIWPEERLHYFRKRSIERVQAKAVDSSVAYALRLTDTNWLRGSDLIVQYMNRSPFRTPIRGKVKVVGGEEAAKLMGLPASRF